MARRFPPEIYTRDEILALLRVVGTGITAARNRALIIVMWRAGLRVSEALALRPSDLDRSGTLRVRHGKGDRPRMVGLDPQALAVVDLWLALRSKLPAISARAPVFCTLKGDACDPKYVRAMLRRLAKRSGLAKRVHPHGFRHTYAAELEREGVRPRVIQAALGHTSLGTTTRYLGHITGHDVVQAINRREPWRPER